jgi:hypothetical protein
MRTPPPNQSPDSQCLAAALGEWGSEATDGSLSSRSSDGLLESSIIANKAGLYEASLPSPLFVVLSPVAYGDTSRLVTGDTPYLIYFTRYSLQEASGALLEYMFIMLSGTVMVWDLA